ncbi:hypothetical protein HGI30_05930 [Paenibacillus albicereus]|uniref:Uncharacterized protein n=1 Tax=Paenibacillus albicereus TaxID=2726185 RepID=A0A6H2GVH6_9BACL|nr:hypothetical protein [Paenibacillus albicereus]QJC51148.1 hypothetical protein HGI30_05930 [Paenibacillus albicereus]
MNAKGQMFHCLGCGQLLHLEAAGKLFQTGFYQASYPLGSCTSCSEPEPAAGSGSTANPDESGAGRGPGLSPSERLYGPSMRSA